MLISIVLATFNGAKYLADQLDSLLNQTQPFDELIICDDASTDSTLKVLKPYLKDRRLKLLTNPQANLGPAQNFARGLSLARGKLVALADQDDLWRANRLETGLSRLEAEPKLWLVHSNARLVEASGRHLDSSLFESLEISAKDLASIGEGRGLEVLLRRNVVTGATCLMRREIIEKALPVPGGWLHDEWLAVVAAMAETCRGLGGFRAINQELIEYRQHTDNEVGARKLGLWQKLSRLLEPGAQRNERLLLRTRSWADRVERDPDLLPIQPSLRAKLAHETRRSGLSRRRIARVKKILTGLRLGQYRQFGRGGVDALRDLIQPL